MKRSTVLKLVVLVILEAALGIFLYSTFAATLFSWGKYLALAGVIALSLGVDWLVMRADSAVVISDTKKLKDAQDYIAAFEAWLREDPPFPEELKVAIRQLNSLIRKQQALRAILGNDTDSAFLTTAQEVDAYILSNCKRVLNRVMIYDSAEPQHYQTHVTYLRQVLAKNAHVLLDFDNLILEVSQIADGQYAETPCLNELTAALRSVRDDGVDAWDESNTQITQAPAQTQQRRQNMQ